MQQPGLPIEQHCPVCGGEGSHAYTGRDLLHGVPGRFDYAACADCGAVFQYPVPGLDRIAAFYPGDYKPYSPPVVRPPGALRRAVLAGTWGYRHLAGPLPRVAGRAAAPFCYRKSIPFARGGALLDVGCGAGGFLADMRQLGWRVRGVELNPGAVACCREAGLDVFCGELRDAGFPGASFNAVTANHVIEHIAEPRAFMAEIARVLKPGGMLHFRTPNARALGRPWFGACWFANDIPRHLVLYHRGNLARLAGDAGLELRQSRTRSTPKIVLNSWDLCRGNTARPSRKRPLRRLAGRMYALVATALGRGDELIASFEKRRT